MYNKCPSCNKDYLNTADENPTMLECPKCLSMFETYENLEKKIDRARKTWKYRDEYSVAGTVRALLGIDPYMS